MAEIRVEKKGASMRRWLWLVPVALLALVAVYMGRGDGEETAAALIDTATGVDGATDGALDTSTAATVPAGVPADPALAVTAYTAYVGRGEPEMADTAQTRYAAGGLVRLADAFAALGGANASAALTDAIATMRRQAEQLPLATGTEPTPMEIIKPAFTAAATALGELRTKAGTTDVAPAISSAEVIPSRGALRPQREKIQNFFDRTSTVLQGIQGTSGASATPPTPVVAPSASDTSAARRP